MKHLLLSLALFFAFSFPAGSQEIVAEVSQYDVELTPSFKGQDLFIFGAIKNGGDLSGERFDIVLIIKGEARPHVVRKKERIYGFWLNADSRTLLGVPQYFGQASTRPLSEIADPETLKALGLGIDEQPFVTTSLDQGEAEMEFVRGLIRYKQDAGLFQISEDELPVMSDVLFRADFFFPPKVPSGTYEATAYLFQGGKLVGRTDKAIRVDQVGLERALYVLAHEHPALYGIMAILIALLAGWLAGYITRGRSKLG